METIKFEEPSRLKKIGERAFMGSDLHSITIPALTEEIDGSAFVNCPWITIHVAPGSLHFQVEGDMLVTSGGTEIVRYFGLDREIIVGKKVQVLGKSCFERCNHLHHIGFEIGSELERIAPAALLDCGSLISIEIPESVTTIGEGSFEGCVELESCLMPEDSSLVTIGARAFAKCTSLRSFYVPGLVGKVGNNCFAECVHLYRLMFQSSESLKSIVGDGSLDDALEEVGVSGGGRSSLFTIEVDDGMEWNLPGWVSVWDDGDGDLQLTLVRDIQ
jgi:hypothetical protein